MENKSNSTEAVQVSVSLSGKDFVSAQQHFQYYLPPMVHSVYPEIVPVGEQTELVIRGSDFLPLTEASCFVAGTKIPANVISRSEIRCKTSLNETYSNQVLPVGVALNGKDVSSLGYIFVQVHMPITTSISPLYAPDSGGSVIELTGYGFENIEQGLGYIKLTVEYSGRIPQNVILSF